jgi:DNA-binding transcriptional ArsR family regulator
MKKLLVEKEVAKEILIFKKPRSLKALINPIAWKILQLLARKPSYPSLIAKKLNLYPQKVYYYVNQLLGVGAIEVEKEVKIKGGIARYYRLAAPSFGVELPGREERIASLRRMDPKLRSFFDPIIRDAKLDARIVVGCPDPHGPFKARARDGHYGIYLALFLGQWVELPRRFSVKLDIDVKAEKEEGENLILIGGPGTNVITYQVNKHLEQRFNIRRSKFGFLLGGLVSKKTGNVYVADPVGVVAKLRNPFNKKKSIIVLAGNRSVGTKACILAITKFWKKTLKSYEGEESWSCVLQGFDLDGDGKIDSIEVLEY